MSESDETMMPKNGIDSPSADDADSGGSVGANGHLKKGPWTSSEDAILVEYVNKHGEGNWNAVQKHSGLARCGKSCRLRWANHLRPDLKKGAFSPEEEQLIVELHAKMGNKWARMAAELPGRTDNEIKNYWNTRIKRKLRAGLPLYPPDISSQSLNENQQNDDTRTFSSVDAYYPDFTPANIYEFHDIEFKTLAFNNHFYQPPLLDFPSSSFMPQWYPNTSSLSTIHPPKRLRASEAYFPGLTDNAQYFIYPPGYDHSSTCNLAPSSSLLSGSHAVLNGNTSSSEPAWATKMELPSLQTQSSSWGPPSCLLPSLESVDTFSQTLPNEHALPCNVSARNSGLLDAVLLESQTLRNSENDSHQKMSYASDMAVDKMDPCSQGFHETEWEAYRHATSPLGRSSSSVFSDSTPISASSFDEPESLETIQEATTMFPTKYSNKDDETTKETLFNRPDLMLGSDCFVPMRDSTWDQSLLNDAIRKLLN